MKHALQHSSCACDAFVVLPVYSDQEVAEGILVGSVREQERRIVVEKTEQLIHDEVQCLHAVQMVQLVPFLGVDLVQFVHLLVVEVRQELDVVLIVPL